MGQNTEQYVVVERPILDGGAIPVVNTTFNPRWVDVPIFVPSGGKSRKKVPRLYQRDLETIDHDINSRPGQ